MTMTKKKRATSLDQEAYDQVQLKPKKKPVNSRAKGQRGGAVSSE